MLLQHGISGGWGEWLWELLHPQVYAFVSGFSFQIVSLLGPPAQDSGAGKPHETRSAHIRSRSWRTLENHPTWSIASSETRDPARLSCHWPETSRQQSPHFLTSSQGARLGTGWHSWKRSSSPPSGLVSCLRIISVYRRDWRRSLSLPLYMSFVYGNFSSLLAVGLGQVKLEQPERAVTGVRYRSVLISCKVSSGDFSKEYIHWYRHKPNQGIEHLAYVVTAPALKDLGGKKNKIEARKDAPTSTSTLKIRFLEKEDEATYYCARWFYVHSVRVSWVTHTRTISSSVPTHILNTSNYWGCTAESPA